MATEDIERLRYYQRQYLGAQDFEDQQAYHRDMRRRHNLAHHTWGIVTGLELTPQGTNSIYITPGMAIDGYGREIVLLQPMQLDPLLFQSFRDTQYRAVCIEYIEELAQRTQAGYEQCDLPNQFERIREDFRVVVDDPFRDDLVVAGVSVLPPAADPKVPRRLEDTPVLPFTSGLSVPSGSTPPPVIALDESLPYQEFPDETTTPRWRIQLGKVKWDNLKQQFVIEDPDKPFLKDGRHYIGDVTSRLFAPAGTLVVRDRETGVPLPPFDPNNPDGVAMFIEGTLEVERTLQVDGVLTAKSDIQIHGGALDFRDKNGSSDGTDTGKATSLFTIASKIKADPGGKTNPGGVDLRVQIGAESGGKNKFVVGTAANDLFTVIDNGEVQVGGLLKVTGNVTIDGVLGFGGQPRQMIRLWSSPADKTKQNGIGVLPSGSLSTTFFRSTNDFFWLQGGTIDDNGNGDPGQLLLKLDAKGNLSFGARTRQMLQLYQSGLGDGYGIGVQASTLYYRSDSDFCWFQGGAHDDARGIAGPGGKLLMTLDKSGSLSVTGPVKLASDLMVHGVTDLKSDLIVEGVLDLKGGLALNDPLDLKSDLTVDGLVNLKRDLTIAGVVNFGQQERQMLNLWATDYGIGVQDSTLYYRSDSDFCWFRGGSHDNTRSGPGLNGKLRMRLNTSGVLEVQGDPTGYIGFTDTVNGLSVKIGLRQGPHGADSIYGSPNLWLDADNTVFIKHGFQSFGGDGAEFFPSDEALEAGDVVVLSPEGKRAVKRAEEAYNTAIVGVVSTSPSFILRGPAAVEAGVMPQNTVAVALIGTVPCKIDADIAPVHIGDLLTTSPTKGHAQKMLDSSKAVGAVLGKAMGDLENGKGIVSILVMLC